MFKMFVFSALMLRRSLSQKIQNKGEKCQSNAHFSGVHQRWHVKAFHVVLRKNSAPLLLFALTPLSRDGSNLIGRWRRNSFF